MKWMWSTAVVVVAVSAAVSAQSSKDMRTGYSDWQCGSYETVTTPKMSFRKR